MTPIACLRAKIDKLNKMAAKQPPLVPGRSGSELVNTSANARGMASLRYPKAKLARM